MTPSSTSNSEIKWDTIPESPSSLLRWGLALVIVLLGEFAVRAAYELHIVEQPVLYANGSIDRKVESFLDDFIPASLPGERLLILGSSVAATNISPETMTGEISQLTGDRYSAFNWGVYGGRFEDFLFLDDWAHDRWPYDALVFVLEPWSFRYWSMGINRRMDKFPLEDWLMRRTALFSFRNQWKWWDPGLDNRLRGLRVLDETPTFDGWNRTLHARLFMDTPEENAAGSASALYFYGDNPPSLYLPRMEYPLELREKAAARGVTVYWVLSPARPELEQFMPDVYTIDERREMARKLADAPNNHLIDLIDMERDGLLSLDDFFDSTHLNGRGAQIMSRELGRRIAEIITGTEIGRDF